MFKKWLAKKVDMQKEERKKRKKKRLIKIKDLHQTRLPCHKEKVEQQNYYSITQETSRKNINKLREMGMLQKSTLHQVPQPGRTKEK